MFIRKVFHTDKKNNTVYHTFKLIESVRTERGPRQRMVLNLGADFNVPEEKWGQNQFCYRIVEDDKSFALFADLENKKDVDCKNESFECGGEKYCYRDVLAAEVIK